MGKKVKVVLDTNVWISVLLDKLLAKNLVPLIEQGKISVYLSREISKELARVLTYPKIRTILEKADVDLGVALSGILSSVTLVEPRKTVKLIKEDPPDNRVLECALAARAEFIVSGDKHLLGLGKFGRIKILRPKEFLETL